MGLGVLNYAKLDHAPGTVLLDDLSVDESLAAHNLKKGTGRNSHIILAPQPSDDPNDPLNWPLWQRDLNMGIIFMGALLFACVMTPMISAGTAVIAVNLGVSIAKVSQLSGYQLLVAAALGFSALANLLIIVRLLALSPESTESDLNFCWRLCLVLLERLSAKLLDLRITNYWQDALSRVFRLQHTSLFRLPLLGTCILSMNEVYVCRSSI